MWTQSQEEQGRKQMDASPSHDSVSGSHSRIPSKLSLEKDTFCEFFRRMSERCRILQSITSSLCCFFQEHSAVKEQVAEHLITREGDSLLRDSVSSPDSYILTSQWECTPQDIQITRNMAMESGAYPQAQYLLDGEAFKKVPTLVHHCVGICEPVLGQVGAGISQPVPRGLPLRYLEEICESEAVLLLCKTQPSRSLSMSIMNGRSQEHTCCHYDLQRTEEQCLSKRVCLNRRQMLTSHHTESILPLGLRTKYMETLVGSRALVFQMDSEPPRSPTTPRLAYKELTEMSFMVPGSQLCSNPPTKPSLMSSVKLAHVLHTQPCDPSIHSPHQLQQLHHDLSFGELKTFNLALKERIFTPLSSAGIIERLRTGEDSSSSQQKPKACLAQLIKNFHCPCLDVQKVPDKKEDHMLLQDMLENRKKKVTELHQTEWRDKGFQPPVFQMISAFSPQGFRSRLLPTENKPLEMSILRKIKDLLDHQDNRTITKHILQADCKVARILRISEEIKDEMGVKSGLELVTLPHGKQLCQDLMERHDTMAFWVAVTILASTGHPEERAAVLNRFLLIAKELKDTVGDFFAFSAILKALEMLQITRLEQTWASLRRKHTRTAIMYAKYLKPFCKGLYEGSITVTPGSTTVPLLMPLLTLMERPSVVTDDGDVWDISDLGYDSTLRHLESARIMARNTEACVTNAERILHEFQPNEDLLEIFTTDFQLRLLWGSRGALVDQKQRFKKFNLILTALSKKLEPSLE